MIKLFGGSRICRDIDAGIVNVERPIWNGVENADDGGELRVGQSITFEYDDEIVRLASVVREI